MHDRIESLIKKYEDIRNNATRTSIMAEGALHALKELRVEDKKKRRR